MMLIAFFWTYSLDGEIHFDINETLVIDPPVNDSPCINDTNGPLDLTEINSHIGTTCGAIGAK